MMATARRYLGVLVLTLLCCCLATSSASAWTYIGYKWPGYSCTYDDAGLPSGWNLKVRSAASNWNQSGSLFSLNRSTGSGNYWAAADLGDIYDGGPGARTYISKSGSTITGCITYFNINDSLEWSTTGEAGKADVESVAVHEFGHWLGLGHSEYSTAVMYYALALGQVRRSLSLDDINGACYIYAD
jgi:hypothetical protein